MDRRTAIRNLALVIGGAALLPSCVQDHGKASIALKKIDINGDQEKLLADIAETIIPKTDTPGARDLNLHLFVMKMVDDCFSPDDQKAFTNGLDQFAKAAEDRYHKPFGQCSQTERENLLNELDHKLVNQRKEDKKKNAGPTPAPPKDDLLAFYNLVKTQTVFGYTYSKYFMTKQVVYELVPGRYNVHVPVKKVKELQHA